MNKETLIKIAEIPVNKQLSIDAVMQKATCQFDLEVLRVVPRIEVNMFHVAYEELNDIHLLNQAIGVMTILQLDQRMK
jgi:hypothetical protein